MSFLGGFSPSRNSGSADAPNTSRSKVTKTKGQGGVVDFISKGGITGAAIRAVAGVFDTKKNKKSKSGDVYGYDEAKEKIDYKENPFTNGSGNDNQPKGIELAKASTGSATILGPGEIQKEAANNVKGPTTTEMSADQIALANKRKGRRSTNITAKKTLAKNYKLSEKTLLG